MNSPNNQVVPSERDALHIYKDVGDEDETGEADVDSLTLGAVYSF